jgi:type I restriction enzyme S subunit
LSWPLVKLGDVCVRVSVGHVGKTSEYYTDNSGVPFLRTQNVSKEGVNTKGIKYITKQFHESLKKSQLKENDVILSRVISTNINCGIVPKELNNTNCANIILARPDDHKLDSKFLVYFLRSEVVQRNLLKRKVGSAQSVVNTTVLKSWEIPLPPLAEQKRIAAILDKADAIRRKRQQAIKLADDFLRSVFLDMFGDPVTNPKGFPKGTIRDFVETANYGSSGKASETEGEYPMLRMGNITYQGGWDFTNLKYVDLSEKDKPKYLTQKGDLLFNRTNSKELVGKTAVFEEDKPMAIAGYLVRVRTNELGNNYYLSGYLNSTHGKKTLVGMCKSIVGMANINAQEVQNIKIALPPIELQNRFEQIVKDVSFKVKKHEISQKSLGDLFNSLSQKAFSGEL